MANFIEALENEQNVTVTENGATLYRSAGNDLLDLNFSLPSLRDTDEESIWIKFDHMANPYLNDPASIALLFKWLFYARDCREGVGERYMFRAIMKYALKKSNKYPFIYKLLNLIPEYGRWDDLISLINLNPSTTEEFIANDHIISIISKQLEEDIGALLHNKPVSLLAKWMPSINTSSRETCKLGNYVRKNLHLSPRDYRKNLATLRKYIDVTEVKMSGNQWNSINYPTVPSNANLKYANAFIKHDSERRQEYLEELKQGKTKINSKVLFPHEIISKYRHGMAYSSIVDDTLEELWKALPNNVEGDQNTIVVCDTSGSMMGYISGSKSAYAMDVSIGLAIYYAERMHGQYKNKIISFSANPKLVDLDKCQNTLVDKICYVEREAKGYNTDISKVFNLILDTAIKNKFEQSDMPDNILLVSDMEFDAAVDNYTYTTHDFDFYRSKFEAAGYKMPRIIFWNVNSRTNGIPMKENDLGVALISGFSTNLCKMVMSKEKDPLAALVEQLDTERYRPIEEIINNEYQLLNELY